jgi:hypothetical protein
MRRHGLNSLYSHDEIAPMAKPNYSFEKRQREIAKKKKNDEKLAKKQAAKDAANPPGTAEQSGSNAGDESHR